MVVPCMEESVIYLGALKKLRLTTSEYVVMDFIDHMVGDRADPFSTLRQVRLSQIAEWVHLSQTQCTRIVLALEARGFVKKGIEYKSRRLWPTKKWYETIELYREEENGQ